MSWGDPNSAAARAVARRAARGLDSRARRRVLARGAKDRHTRISVTRGAEDEEWNEQNGHAFPWPFR